MTEPATRNPDPSSVWTVDVMVLGAGFAGAILARCLRARGLRVLLVEKARHPRFALGESSTPLANLVLERLALRYGLEDLYHLAGYGRWRRELPAVMRGLKRGFTFYQHVPGVAFSPGPGNCHRLLAAASPDDEIADCQWLRSDVDSHLVARAVAEGVEYLDRTMVDEVDFRSDRVAVALSTPARRLTVDAGFVVDGTGSAAVVARAAGVVETCPDVEFSTRLLYSHFEAVPDFESIVGSQSNDALADAASGWSVAGLPYAPDGSAVHHLLDVGWMYQLRFDDRRSSCGIVVDIERARALGLEVDWSQPADSFWRLCRRFPSLGRQLEGARPLLPIAATGRLQRRLSGACGDRWALLPHTYAFYSPLFSTGIAWSMVAVERLAEVLAPLPSLTARLPGEDQPPKLSGPDSQGSADPGLPGLGAYRRLMEKEADHLERLLDASYSSLGDCEAFFGVAEMYLAAASFSETCQRLCSPSEWLEDESPGPWAWRGFLGATDTVLGPLFEELRSECRQRRLQGSSLRSWIGRRIERRNVAGLADASKQNLFPADLDALLGLASRYGLDLETARARKSRLRSPASFSEACDRG